VEKISVPNKLNLGVHEFEISFDKTLVDAQSYGRTLHASEYIRLNPINTDAQNNVTFWHEFFHAISSQQLGRSLTEEDACCLSEGTALILKQLGVTLDFSELKKEAK
jgi:Zn-dependent peptidase ImmA (M78 family)